MSSDDVQCENTLTYQHIVDAINQLICRKAKPNLKNVRSFLSKCHQQCIDSCPAIVDQLVDQCLSFGYIINVKAHDEKSLRTPEKLISMSRMCKVVPYAGIIFDSVVIEIASKIADIEIVNQHSFVGYGVKSIDLLNYLHNKLCFLNYTQDILENKVLKQAISKNYVKKLDNGNYSLTKWFRNEQNLYVKSASEVECIVPLYKITHTSHPTFSPVKPCKKLKLQIPDEKKDGFTNIRVSTRKRKMKTHGPDFIEENSLRQWINITNCIICNRPIDKNHVACSSNKKQPTEVTSIKCNRCDNGVHIGCISIRKFVGLPNQWHCGCCAICAICKTVNKSDFLITCAKCLLKFHCDCLYIEQYILTRRTWMCEKCCDLSLNTKIDDNTNLTTKLSLAISEKKPIQNDYCHLSKLTKNSMDNNAFENMLRSKHIKHNFYIWIEHELKYFMRKLNYEPLFTLPNNIEKWNSNNVQFFVSTLGYDDTRQCFKKITGTEFLKLKKQDLIERLSLSFVSSVKLVFIINRLNEVFNGTFCSTYLGNGAIKFSSKVSTKGLFNMRNGFMSALGRETKSPIATLIKPITSNSNQFENKSSELKMTITRNSIRNRSKGEQINSIKNDFDKTQENCIEHKSSPNKCKQYFESILSKTSVESTNVGVKLTDVNNSKTNSNKDKGKSIKINEHYLTRKTKYSKQIPMGNSLLKREHIQIKKEPDVSSKNYRECRKKPIRKSINCVTPLVTRTVNTRSSAKKNILNNLRSG